MTLRNVIEKFKHRERGQYTWRKDKTLFAFLHQWTCFWFVTEFSKPLKKSKYIPTVRCESNNDKILSIFQIFFEKANAMVLIVSFSTFRMTLKKCDEEI